MEAPVLIVRREISMTHACNTLLASVVCGLIAVPCFASSHNPTEGAAFVDEAAIGAAVPNAVHVLQAHTAIFQPGSDGHDDARTFTSILSSYEIIHLFWLSSFEREATPANHLVSASTVLAADLLTGRVRFSGLTSPASWSSLEPGIQMTLLSDSGLQPGIGACFLAALAIATLTIYRRRNSDASIIPAQSSSEFRIAVKVDA